MPRVKRGLVSHRRHKKLLELAKGYRGHHSTLVRQAKESVLHAGQYAFAGRKQRQRDMRKLWITQLGIAVKNEGLSYSKFMAALKAKDIQLNRKVLAELAVHDTEAFKKVVSEAFSFTSPKGGKLAS
jgi:large subunit ribosomal protein L20